MESKDIVFDENLEFYALVKGLKDKVCIILSDGLYASEEELTEAYKTKIANFINSIDSWYNKSVNAVCKRGEQVYNIKTQHEDLRLLNIYVLYEQGEDELYGLQFWAKFDEEHAVGLKIRGKDFEITEIGTGDVAFC